MTQFTKLSKLLDSLEDRLRTFENDPNTVAALDASATFNGGPLNAQASVVESVFPAISSIKAEYETTIEKTAKLKAKAQLTGEARLYNEKKSLEILAYCQRHEELGTQLEDLISHLQPLYDENVRLKEQEIAEKAMRRQQEEKLKLEAEQREFAELEQAKAQARKKQEEAAMEAARKEAQKLAEERRLYEEKLKAKKSEEGAATAAAAKAAMERKEFLSAQAAQQLHELNKDASAQNSTAGCEFLIYVQIVGEAEQRSVTLERGDQTTILEVKQRIKLQLDKDVAESEFVAFAGGRLLQDDWSLRRCRLRRLGIIQVAIK